MGKYFGTDGFRGEANRDLTVEHAFKIGRYLGYLFGKDKKARIVIGKDTRRSSYMFESALTAGLTASGADVYLMHVTTTPSVAYVVRTDRMDCGIMISASHNPYYDNGIKLIGAGGEKLGESITDEIEKYIDGLLPEPPLAARENLGITFDHAIGRNRYIGYLISLATRSYKGIKVGLDCANGSTWNIAKAVFDALGASTYVINDRPDGLNINEKAGSTHIEYLRDFVIEKGLDIGFAFDGDADRCLAVDDKGEILTGDHILYMCGRYMRENGELSGNTVVTTVMSNLGLYKAFDREGINYVKTQVGDRFVYDCMTENGYRLGGEQSGHIIFSKFATTGDGILTSIKIMEVMLEQKKRSSEITDGLTIYPQTLINVRVTEKAAALSDPRVKAEIERIGRELGDDGRILVRPSGTEPVIRVMVEASTREICDRAAKSVASLIEKI